MFVIGDQIKGVVYSTEDGRGGGVYEKVLMKTYINIVILILNLLVKIPFENQFHYFHS